MISLKDIKDDFPEDVTINGVTCDSREVKPGYIFVAIQGEKNRGEDFVYEAISNGASAIVTSENSKLILDIPLIKDKNPRRYLSHISSTIYKNSRIGTLGIIGNEEIQDTNITTPDPVLLHQTLDRLSSENITHLALEASSHGLSQHRIDSVKVRAAGFTNISQDHLDYHKTMKDYFDAKKRLFTEILPKDSYSVICIDTDEGRELSSIIKNSGKGVIEVGESANALNLRRIATTETGMEMIFQYSGRQFSIPLKVEGYFQAMNILCASGLAIASGSPSEKVFEHIKDLRPIPGRLEFCGLNKREAKIYVDYAHTPDALTAVLFSLRELTEGRLIIVFGCGGGRDKFKRPIMGEIAENFADIVIITDDNPRNEGPKEIRESILKSCPSGIEIPGRKDAIIKAIDLGKKGDSVLIAGKGHEKFQIIGSKKTPFSDQETIREVIGN